MLPIYKGFLHFSDAVETYPQIHFFRLKNNSDFIILWIIIEITFNILKLMIISLFIM